MKKFKKQLILDWLSIFWLSICAYILTLSFGRSISFEQRFPYALSVFFATVFIYSLARISLKGILPKLVLLISSICSLYFFLESELSFFSSILIGSLFFLSLFYVLPLKYLNVRSIPYLKSLFVSLVWLFVVVLIPSFEINGSSLNLNFTLFCLLFSNILIFDIKERKKDDRTLKTFPQLFGIKKSILFNYFLLILGMFSASVAPLNVDLKIGIISLFFVNVVFIYFFIKHIQKFIFSIIIDAFLCALAIILIIFSI